MHDIICVFIGVFATKRSDLPQNIIDRTYPIPIPLATGNDARISIVQKTY